jgi:hypothetical protein
MDIENELKGQALRLIHLIPFYPDTEIARIITNI